MTEKEANQIFQDMVKACLTIKNTFPVMPEHPFKGDPRLFMYGYPITKETAPFIATILRLSESVARAEDRTQLLEYDLKARISELESMTLDEFALMQHNKKYEELKS